MYSTQGLLTTADTYTVANQLECPQGVRINIHVFNAAIYFAIGNGPVKAGAQLGPSVYRAPGMYSLDRHVDLVAVKSATAGTPALVSIDVWRPGELSA